MKISNNLCIIPATADEAYFVRNLFVQNMEKLNIGNISMNEWKEILSQESTGEKYFLFYKGAVPIAYMRIIKAEVNKISLFFVVDGFDYEEIYKFGADFANE